MKTGTRWRALFGFLFAVGYLLIARPPSRPSLIFAVVCVILGCALRSWAAGHLLKGKRIPVGGPYAFIRNPLFVGSFIIGFGLCGTLLSWPLTWTVVVFWMVSLVGSVYVYRITTMASEQELSTSLGEAYRLYASQVPPFLPIRGYVPGLGESRFSSELFRRNREHRYLSGCFIILVCLYTRWRYGF